MAKSRSPGSRSPASRASTESSPLGVAVTGRGPVDRAEAIIRAREAGPGRA